jgi:UDP-N-acetylmuramoyl-tripeptide--D-alanyl-D-alanine ligase
MSRTRFIAVTGSMGKTTATRCLAAALATRHRVNCTRDSNNSRTGLARTVLRTRPSHGFCVMEVGTRWPGAMSRAAFQLKPDIVVFLCVAFNHQEHFKSIDDIVREKAALFARLDHRGIGVFNGDDPHVMSTAHKCPGKVVTFGRGAGFDFQATDVESVWPRPLRFVIHSRAGSALVETALYGEHWVDAVTGALAAAVTCGIPLREAAAAIREVAPFPARLQPAELPSGAIMLRDEYQGSMTSMSAAFRVLGGATGVRRVVVHGDLWDSGMEDSARYDRIGQECAAAADVAIFVGPVAPRASVAALSAGLAPGNVHAIPSLRDAAAFLGSTLRAGDLVLLRGKTEDHLSRLYHAQLGPVGCWIEDCTKAGLCDFCPQLHKKK